MGWSAARTARRATAALLALTFVLATVAAAPAGAQDDDPYGSTTTTAKHGQRPSCRLRTEAGEVGSQASVTVKRVDRGATVRVLFDGRQVAEADATAPGSSAQVNVDIDFTVPEAEPGTHEVTAVGADFTASCRTAHGDGFQVVASGEVLASEVTRPESSDGGSLPRTGMYFGLVLAALALLVVGWVLLAGSKRRGDAATGARPRTGV